MTNGQTHNVLLSLALFLTPLLAFADTSSADCRPHPKLSGCVVPMPEHWGAFENISFFAIALGILWLLIRLRAARMNKV
jgi:hypothetical protein